MTNMNEQIRRGFGRSKRSEPRPEPSPTAVGGELPTGSADGGARSEPERELPASQRMNAALRRRFDVIRGRGALPLEDYLPSRTEEELDENE